VAKDFDKPRTPYLPESKDPLIGTTVASRYLVQGKLGEGGMGSVYLAMHTILEKQVALKVLHGEFARKPDLVERFMQEAKAASRIRHENVIDISDFGTTPEGVVFFAMELLKGHELHADIARARKAGELLPWLRTKKIFLQICAALSAAHAKGVVHRDLKPENVYLVEFLGDPDFVKLLDFGIAKLTELSSSDEGARKLTKTGMLFGTPEYMSPEQARGESVDHRVDVYAMGCILFQLVTGRVPFEADNFMGVLSLHITEPPPIIAPEVFDHIGAPRGLGAVIDRALVKDRGARWQTIDDFAAAVREVCGDSPVSVSRVRPPTGPMPPEVLRSRPPTGPMPPEVVRSREPTGRHRTEWTGNLRVPEVPIEPPRRPRASRAPLVISALVAIGGVGVATYITTRDRSDASAPQGSGSAQGSELAAASGSATGSAPALAAPPPPPAAPTPPARVTLQLDSQPHGATVKDLTTGKQIGRTPLRYEIAGSTTPRQFVFHLHGYTDSTLELVPDRETIEYVEKLATGARAGVVDRVPDVVLKPADIASGSATRGQGPSGAVAHPEVGSGAAATATDPTAAARTPDGAGSAGRPPDSTGATAKPRDKPEQKCSDDDVLCLKGFGSGS
jgi:serine/threonine-protein kinase